MTCPSRTLLAFLGGAAIASTLGAADTAPAYLDATLPDGGTSIILAQGATTFVHVSVQSLDELAFNAVLMRLIVSDEGTQVLQYSWNSPFTTGGVTDFSLGGQSPPVTIMDDTLDGPGYPVGVADVEFANFSLFADATDGSLLTVLLRAPPDAPAGAVYFVIAVPDLFTDGFVPISIQAGKLLTITIANSGVPGDLTGDGVVDSSDLGLLLNNWGGTGAGDLDGNGIVDAADLGTLLVLWS